VEVIDLRGRAVSGVEPAVLADPSGRRLRRLRVVGRALFVLFALWLCALVLAGLGVLPSSGIPFAGSAATPSPPALAQHPVVHGPSAAELRPAVPASVAKANGLTSGGAAAPTRTSSAKHASGVAPKAGKPTITKVPSVKSPPTATPLTSPGASSAAPGQTKTTTTLGSSSAAPGHTKTTSSGSTSAPGQTGTAPGQTQTHPGQAKHQQTSTTQTSTTSTTTTPGHGRGAGANGGSG